MTGQTRGLANVIKAEARRATLEFFSPVTTPVKAVKDGFSGISRIAQRVYASEVDTNEPRLDLPFFGGDRFEGLVGIFMVAAIVLLAVGLIYGILTAGSSDAAWMR